MAGDLSSPPRRRMAACSAGGLHRAVTSAASSRMRRIAACTVRRGRAGVASTASVYRSRAARPPHGPRSSLAQRTTPTRLQRLQGGCLHLQKAALGAVLQPLIEVSGAARALAMNASPQPLRHAAGTAATGRVARLSTKINSTRSTASARFPLLLRALGGLAEEQSGTLKPAG